MEKKYFNINYELDNKITGKGYPQVNCLNLNDIGKFSSWELNKEKTVLKFELNKKSKLTDVLSVLEINTGFLISAKVKKIFNDFKLMRHQYFDATIETNEGIFDYYWLHLTEPDLVKKIDYKKSIFYETEYTFKKKIIFLDNYEQYQKLKSKDEEASFGVTAEHIFFSSSFDKTIDLFTFLPFNNDIYISERLKNALVENNIYSFNIKQSNVISEPDCSDTC